MTIAPLSDLAVLPGLSPVQMIGIPLALIGAVFLSLGAMYQHRGVSKVEAASGTSGAAGLNLKHLLALLSRPSWVIGTVMLGLAVVMQLSSFVFSPIIVVQPKAMVTVAPEQGFTHQRTPLDTLGVDLPETACRF